MTDQPNATAVDKSWTVPCPEYRCGAPAGEACLRLDGTRSTVSHMRRWRAYDRAQQAHAKSAPAPMTPVPDYIAGARALLAATSDCTINGEPAVVVRVAELNDLTARLHEAEAAARPAPPQICELPHETIAEEDECERRRTAARTTPDNPAANADATTRHVGTSAVAAPATADDGLREQYAAALTAAAYQCDGDCGLNEHECFNSHPITWSGMVAGHTHITGGATDIAEICLAVRDRRMKQLTTRAEGVERSVQLLTTDLLNVAQQRDQAEATIARVRALAADMRTWCSHHDVAVDYAQRIDDALAGPETDHA